MYVTRGAQCLLGKQYPEKSRGACSADLEGSETSTLVVLSHVNIAVTPSVPSIAT